MTNTASVIKDLRKAHGDDIGGLGMTMPPRPRVPSGILALDVASGGGIPTNRMSMIYGAESSCKTNLSLCFVREFQRLHPDKVCVYIDAEVALDTDWMKVLRVDVDRLVVVRPDYAEQAIDACEAFLLAKDTGLVVVDSIAAMSTMQEIEKGSEEHSPGTAGRAMGKMVRKTTAAMGCAEKDGSMATMLWVNQIRYKIGVTRGNPETLPGGQGQRYMASMRIRVYGKDEIDKKINEALPAWKVITGTIEKHKVPIVNKKFTFKMAMLRHKVGHGVLLPGQAYDWPAAKRYATDDLGWLVRPPSGKGWLYRGDHEFARESDLWSWLNEDRSRLDDIVNAVIAKRLETVA